MFEGWEQQKEKKKKNDGFSDKNYPIYLHRWANSCVENFGIENILFMVCMKPQNPFGAFIDLWAWENILYSV